jgi:hypothetical protein
MRLISFMIRKNIPLHVYHIEYSFVSKIDFHEMQRLQGQAPGNLGWVECSSLAKAKEAFAKADVSRRADCSGVEASRRRSSSRAGEEALLGSGRLHSCWLFVWLKICQALHGQHEALQTQ